MKILDCHLFYGATNNGQPYRNCDTFAALAAELDRAGISGGLVRCAYSNTVGVNYGNRFLAEDLQKSGNPDLWGVWAVLPRFTNETPAVANLPAEMKKNHIGAVYLDPRTHRYVLDPLTMGDCLDMAQQLKIPVMLHTSLGLSMEQIYALMKEFPRLTAIVGDCDSWPNARRLYPLAELFENLHLDLSFVMDAGGVEDMVSRFGAEKLLFGSAFPARYMGSMLAVVRAAAISEKDRALIFGGNLERLLKGGNYDAE